MAGSRLPVELLSQIISSAVRGGDWHEVRHLRLVNRFFADGIDRVFKALIFGPDLQDSTAWQLHAIGAALLGRLIFEVLDEHPESVFVQVLRDTTAALKPLRRLSHFATESEVKLNLCILAAKKEPVSLALRMVRNPPEHLYNYLQYDPADALFPLGFVQALAAFTGDLPLLEAASEFLQDFSYASSWFAPALLLAAENGHVDCTKFLLDNSAIDQTSGGTPGMDYIWAPNLISKYRSFEYHECSLAMYRDYDPQDHQYENAASMAARRGHTAILQTLFDYETADRTKHFHTPKWAVAFEEAVRAGQLESVKFIMDITDDHCRNSINHRGFTQAARVGRIDLMELIFANSDFLDCPFTLDTELWEAAWRGNHKVVSWLLSHGIKPEQINERIKKNVLMAAVWHGIPDLVQPLASIMDPHERLSHPLLGANQTLLSIARQRQRSDIARLLLQHGGRANITPQVRTFRISTRPKDVVSSVVKAIRR